MSEHPAIVASRPVWTAAAMASGGDDHKIADVDNAENAVRALVEENERLRAEREDLTVRLDVLQTAAAIRGEQPLNDEARSRRALEQTP